MKISFQYHRLPFLFLILLLSISASAAPEEHIKTPLIPSDELLKIAAVEDYEVSEWVFIRAGVGKNKATTKNTGDCVRPSEFHLMSVLKLMEVRNSSQEKPQITKISAAIESETKKHTKLLFTLEDAENSPSLTGYFHTVHNIRDFTPDILHIWVFFFTKETVYANAVKVICDAK